MPQIPVVSDAVQRVRDIADTLIDQGRTTVTDVVDTVRGRLEALPAMPTAMVDELRRHLNMSELATKDDVEYESRQAGRRMALLMESFVAEQRAALRVRDYTGVKKKKRVGCAGVDVQCAGLMGMSEHLHHAGKIVVRETSTQAGIGLRQHLRGLKAF